MKITTEELIEVNKELGGALRSDSSLKFAEASSKNDKSNYRCAAVWLRAILVDHPFTDANKRTAVYAIAKLIGIKNHTRVRRVLAKIATKNVASLKKIEEMIKNANRQETF